MTEPTGYISRAKLLKAVLATGALAACSGGVNPTPFGSLKPNFGSSGASGLASLNATDMVNEIFSHQAFANLDKKALVKAFDPSPHIRANQQKYFAAAGQLVHHAPVINTIHPDGMVIDKPGNYTSVKTSSGRRARLRWRRLPSKPTASS